MLWRSSFFTALRWQQLAKDRCNSLASSFLFSGDHFAQKHSRSFCFYSISGFAELWTNVAPRNLSSVVLFCFEFFGGVAELRRPSRNLASKAFFGKYVHAIWLITNTYFGKYVHAIWLITNLGRQFALKAFFPCSST